jgi:ABC-type phosphate/phosphonate transport system substrate-binding protein
VIANARMYAVSAEAAALWRTLLGDIIGRAGLPVSLIEHAPPAPIAELWARTDKAAVFMCGLPFSLAEPRPVLIAAPVPSPVEFNGQPCYWSNLVVRADSSFQTVRDTFGRRIAFTTPDSESGYGAALHHLMGCAESDPLFAEIVAPQFTPRGVLMAVIRGLAEIAPIDSYAFVLLQRYCPELTSQVRVIGKTAPMPIPPLVASAPGLDALAAAFIAADRDPAVHAVMEQLLLRRFVRPDAGRYAVLRENFQAAKQYWRERRLASLVHPAFTDARTTAP